MHASTFTVTTTADNVSSPATGSLRRAIEQANTAGGTNTIAFSVTGTITLAGELPVIQDDGLTIDGTSAPGYAGTPVVTIDGGSAYRCLFVGAWTSGTSTQVAVNVTIAGLNLQNCAAAGGAGGFGGGGGISASGLNSAPGGGGLGAGGAVFVQQGGTLDFSGTLTETGDSVTGGAAGGTGAGNGSAFGSAIFIQGDNTITFSPASGNMETITGAIADQTGSGGTGGNAGAGGVTMNGAGTLVLSGANTYTGATTVESGTLDVNGSLSASTTVYVDDGATLGGSGTINGNVVLLGAGATIDHSGGLHINGATTTWLFDAGAGTPQAAYVSTAFAAPLQVTVTANGAGVNGLTVNFTTTGSGASAVLSAASCVTDVTGSCSVTATANTTPGSYAVTASVSGYSGLGSVSFLLANTIPTLVVTSTGDDAGLASNCTFQASPVAGTDTSCSLRDALLKSASVGAASIFFDATKFAGATTITLGSALPAINEPVTITGPGANLLTVSGNDMYQVLTVGSSGNPTVGIAGLTIANGRDALLLLFGMGGLRKRGRAVRRLLCVLLLVATCAAATLINGCGAHAGFFTQAPQSYPITITATSGNVQNSITFTLTVE